MPCWTTSTRSSARLSDRLPAAPVGIMVSIEDAADTLLPEFLLDKTPGYDGWLFEKVTATLERLDAGQTTLHAHDEAMALLRERVAARNRRA